MSTEKKFFILEQPQEHGQRFRYATEKREGGNLYGENDGHLGQRSYPKLKLSDDIEKSDRHYVLISCVEADPLQHVNDMDEQPKYRVHPCSITGRHVKNDRCKIYFNKYQSLATLDHIGIQMTERNSVEASIRRKVNLGLDFYNVGSHNLEPYDMKKLRLSFQVHVWNDDLKEYHVLPPQVSNVILDQRHYNPLIIDEVMPAQAPFEGDTNIIILTLSKIYKTNTSIVFESEEGMPLNFNLEPEFRGTQALKFRSPKLTENVQSFKAKLFLRRQNKDGTHEDSNKIDFTFFGNRARYESGYNSDAEGPIILLSGDPIMAAAASGHAQDTFQDQTIHIQPPEIQSQNAQTVMEVPLPTHESGLMAELKAAMPDLLATAMDDVGLLLEQDINFQPLEDQAGPSGIQDQSAEAPTTRQDAKRKHVSEATISYRSIAIPSKKVVNNGDDSGPSFAELATNTEFLATIINDAGLDHQETNTQPSDAQIATLAFDLNLLNSSCNLGS